MKRIISGIFSLCVGLLAGPAPDSLLGAFSGLAILPAFSDTFGESPRAGGMSHAFREEMEEKQWSQPFNPSGIAIDSSGNAYVAGVAPLSTDSTSFVTVKYDRNGKEIWAQRYGATTPGLNMPTGVAVDSAGNAYVTGGSPGSQGQHDHDFATVKYDSSGKQIWVQRYNGPANGSDWATGIAVDSSGNCYVTGDSQISDSEWDFATLKYNKDGKALWMKRYTGPAKGSNRPAGIAVDSAGNAYVSGDSQISESSFGFATLKYDKNGKQLWVGKYNVPGYGFPVGLGVDKGGSVYVSGNVSEETGGSFFNTIRYSKDGKQLWQKRYAGPGYNVARGIAVDSAGNAYVAGQMGTESYGQDMGTIAYKPDGKKAWKKTYDGPGKMYDEASAIAVDSKGNVYVTGQSYGGDTGMDFATIKYARDGKRVWVTRYNGKGNGMDTPRAIAVDSSGNAYVTGQAQIGTGEDYGFATIKYDSDGKQVWDNYYSGE